MGHWDRCGYLRGSSINRGTWTLSEESSDQYSAIPGHLYPAMPAFLPITHLRVRWHCHLIIWVDYLKTRISSRFHVYRRITNIIWNLTKTWAYVAKISKGKQSNSCIYWRQVLTFSFELLLKLYGFHGKHCLTNSVCFSPKRNLTSA